MQSPDGRLLHREYKFQIKSISTTLLPGMKFKSWGHYHYPGCFNRTHAPHCGTTLKLMRAALSPAFPGILAGAANKLCIIVLVDAIPSFCAHTQGTFFQKPHGSNQIQTEKQTLSVDQTAEVNGSSRVKL